MAANRPQKTLADYVAIAVCPALIMALVGSLMYFLLEVFHKGPHDDRLRWAVSCFVIGVVLIARISMMQEISERAGLYGLALGVVAYIVVNKYIEYPASNPLAPIGWLVNLLIMAAVWWSAHRLTWDCTLIDEEADASGQGLLQAAGLERQANGSPRVAPEAAKPQAATDPALSWWERYRARREKRLRGHTPGIWIVYYSLAALPLFGLGQLMIPAEPAERRRYAFWLLAIYVAAGLCLLLATSFLGLRRYLRQRRVQMPAAMTGVWFMVGAGFVAGLLALAFLLPRPSAEYFNVVALLTGQEQKPTDFDVLGGKGAKGKGSQTGKGPGEKPGGTTPGKLKSGDQKGGDKRAKSSDQGDKQGKDGEGSKSGNSKNSRDGKSDKSGKGDSKDSSDKGEQKNSADQKGDGEKKHDSDANERKPGDQRDKPTDEKRDETKDEQGSSNSEQQPPPPENEPAEPDKPESSLAQLGTIIKWIIYLLAALAVLYVLIRHWRKVLAMLQGAWQALLELWAWLLGKLKFTTTDELSALENPGPEPPPPFSSFANPFLSGMVETKSVNYVTRYTFAALQAWAYERGLGREPGETPIEFCQRLTEDIPAFEQNVRRLGENYSRVSYARATLGRPSLDALEALWQRMTLPVREAAEVGS